MKTFRVTFRYKGCTLSLGAGRPSVEKMLTNSRYYQGKKPSDALHAHLEHNKKHGLEDEVIDIREIPTIHTITY